MRRRGGPDSSSLEMLLDTICNTFGGVLFLAMLVSIMLAQTRKRTEAEAREEEPRPAVSAADLVRLESDAARLALEIEALEEANAAIRSLAEGFDDPRQEELLAAMEQAERDRTRQESKRATLLRDLAAAQAASAKARAAAAAQNREAGHMADRVNAARDRLEQAVEERRKLMESASALAIAERERSAFQTGGRAPRERKTDRNEFGVMLKYGRLYLMKVLQNGELVVNSTDFAVEGGTTTNKATAKPHAGIDLKRGEGRDRAIEAALDAFPPKRWYPCLVVHPDSFEEFLVLKSVLVSRGYDYRLLPTAGSVFDGQKADARVQ